MNPCAGLAKSLVELPGEINAILAAPMLEACQNAESPQRFPGEAGERNQNNTKNQSGARAMTKAIRIHQTGGPDVLRFEDVEIGDPAPGEIKIRQHAVGVNYIDVYFRTGLYVAPALPFTPGNEGAGEVLAVGRDVKGFVAGDRVAYAGALGGYAQERLIDQKFVVRLPKAISYETGAAMMLKGLTAQFLLRRTFRVKKGDTVLVHAAAGGVGQLLCQWAWALGATVIGTVGSAEKMPLAKKAGAKHVINYSTADFAAKVKDITKGNLCDVVYDGVGKATFAGSLDCLSPFGMYVNYGSASGPVDNFSLGLLAQKGSLFATRPTLFTYIAKRSDLDKMARELFKAVATGDIAVPVHASWPLEEAAKAHVALEARRTTGSTILVP